MTPEPKKGRAAQDDDGEEAGTDEAPAPAATMGGRFAAAVKNAGPVVAGTTKGGGLINNPGAARSSSPAPRTPRAGVCTWTTGSRT
ncbi:hypothetical protein SHKM778_94150 (plasmid) [Streptomyces sp. KM77-8]|uniref:Uncharacterized protein n=1 Tax=Streptomyces haneummycinicus TaxID=3074435 RepID=A0AAT9I0D0_9ACTN